MKIHWSKKVVLTVLIFCISDIKENKNLHELLYLVLLSGNYINAVSQVSVLYCNPFTS